MASTCFGHLHVHLQEFLYIGCFTAACGVMPFEKTWHTTQHYTHHMWIHKSANAKSRFFTGHNTTCGSETTYI